MNKKLLIVICVFLVAIITFSGCKHEPANKETETGNVQENTTDDSIEQEKTSDNSIVNDSTSEFSSVYTKIDEMIKTYQGSPMFYKMIGTSKEKVVYLEYTYDDDSNSFADMHIMNVSDAADKKIVSLPKNADIENVVITDNDVYYLYPLESVKELNCYNIKTGQINNLCLLPEDVRSFTLAYDRVYYIKNNTPGIVNYYEPEENETKTNIMSNDEGYTYKLFTYSDTLYFCEVLLYNENYFTNYEKASRLINGGSVSESGDVKVLYDKSGKDTNIDFNFYYNGKVYIHSNKEDGNIYDPSGSVEKFMSLNPDGTEEIVLFVPKMNIFTYLNHVCFIIGDRFYFDAEASDKDLLVGLYYSKTDGTDIKLLTDTEW